LQELKIIIPVWVSYFWLVIVGLIIVLISAGNTQAWNWQYPRDLSSSADTVYWYEHGEKMTAEIVFDEAALILNSTAMPEAADKFLQIVRQFDSSASIIAKKDAVIHFRLPGIGNQKNLFSTLSAISRFASIGWATPVFYLKHARDPRNPLISSGEIIVQFPSDFTETRIREIENNFDLERSKQFNFAPNTFLYKAGDAVSCISRANQLYEGGLAIYAYPNWIRGVVQNYTAPADSQSYLQPENSAGYLLPADPLFSDWIRGVVQNYTAPADFQSYLQPENSAGYLLPTDPLFPDQWYLRNSGQSGGTVGDDINILPAWQLARGSSDQVIAIVDPDGLDIYHPDLMPNVVSGLSMDYVGGDSDPSPEGLYEYHGTACAGLISASCPNDIGICGVAPHAGIVGHRLIFSDAFTAQALNDNNDIIDIYSNSWGPRDDLVILYRPSELIEEAIEDGVKNGRGGLGSIYVWSAGNGKQSGDNSNFGGYTNSRYTIAVSATNDSGKQAFYSESGANILVNAPSKGRNAAVVTTDPSGYQGASRNDYNWDFGGTSAAAPLVSGVAALMLQVNPDLTWRDVQHILIETAQRNDPEDRDWQLNGAGYYVNHKYGFGRVDASEAVKAAEQWITADPERVTQGQSSPDIPIPDADSRGVSDSIYVSNDIDVEFAEVYFSAQDHTFWGDLEVTLISPDGTESILATNNDSIYPGTYHNWRFGSVRHYGESSKGEWTLRVRDLQRGDIGAFQHWALRLFGTQAHTDDAEPVAEPVADLPFFESFEAGLPWPAYWSTRSTSTGRLQVTSNHEPLSGGFHVTMDSSQWFTPALNELVLSINLAEADDGVRLSFWYKTFNGILDQMPDFFKNSHNSDGVAISADGIMWHKIHGFDLIEGSASDWQYHEIDLGDAAAAAGIEYNDTFKIKFQQYGKTGIMLYSGTFFNSFSGGIALDDISVDHY
jgi:subtilisin-like proprotein convertase family protein